MAKADMGLLQYIATLEGQVREHSEALEEMKIALAHARRIMDERGVRAELPGAKKSGVPEETANVTDGPYTGIGLQEATHRYLVSIGRPQKTPEIRDGLLHGGLETKAENLHSTVFTSLSRLVEKGKVEKVGIGLWVAIAPADQDFFGGPR